MVSNYGKIISANLRHNFLMPFASAVGVVVLTLLLFNITSLQGKEVAKPLEFLLSWVGVMLLTPVFLPEQNKEIREVICSKKIDYLKVCGIRIGYSVLAVVVLVSLFVGMMFVRESSVTVAHWLGGIATALFLGTIGLAAAGISDNTTVGYMVAMLYYLANYGLKSKLGKFYLFSMSGGNQEEKEWLLLGTVFLIMITFAWIKIRQMGVIFQRKDKKINDYR